MFFIPIIFFAFPSFSGGQLFMVKSKTNSSCLRPYGYEGMQVCDQIFEPLDEGGFFEHECGANDFFE